eukprot:4766775-Heterocapsa_arctica.AAC.2
MRIRKASAFVGMTTKDVKQGNIPEGDLKTNEGTLNEKWIRWNQEADNYLCHQEDKRGQYFRGGQQVTYVKHIIAPPQDNSEGFAITEDMKTTQMKLNIMRKYQMLVNKN